jgi:3-methyladenine DNA glycosylase AlkC
MSSYCNCFHCIHIYNKKKYLNHVNEISKTEPLIFYYDVIHKTRETDSMNDFKQFEYNKTISEVNKMKRKLRR